MGYNKLDENIFDSSLTTTGPVPFAVFVLLLSKARPPDGVAEVAPSVVAGRLLISRDECARAFEILQAPDPESRSEGNEGRRIKKVDGGWQILNYERYRGKDYTAAARMRRFRERKAAVKKGENVTHVTPPVTPVTVTNVTVTQAEAEAEAEVLTEQQTTYSTTGVVATPTPSVQEPEAKEPSWSKDACDLWISRFGGTAPGGRIGKALSALVKKHTWPEVRQAWVEYLSSTEALYASPSRFSETFGEWKGRNAPGRQQSPVPPEGEVLMQPEPVAPPGQPGAARAGQGNGTDIPPEGTPEAVELWGAIAKRLELVLASHNHSTWVRPMRGLRIEDGVDPKTGRPAKVLCLVVPNRDWIQHLRGAGYSERMRIAAEDLGHAGMLFRAMVEPKPPPDVHDGSVR